MGAVQAQDYAMAKWAIGVRLPNSTDQAIETAINNGEIIWTHLLRPTWHFVSAKDIYWMLELTAPQIKASLKSRHRGLGLTERVIAKSNTIIQNALADGKYLTRDELVSVLEKSKIRNANNRAAHVLLRAELDGVICSGASKRGKQTYALLEERVPKTRSLARGEALAKLATRYFTSRCPATLHDFIWWSGLSVSDTKQALEMVKSDLTSEIINSQTYWLTNSLSIPKTNSQMIHMLPAYDEFIISYRDRSAALPPENQKKAISQNGVFWPVVVIDGKVAGLWKRTIKKDRVVVEAEFFKQPDKTIQNLIEKAFEQFGNFLEKKIEIG